MKKSALLILFMCIALITTASADGGAAFSVTKVCDSKTGAIYARCVAPSDFEVSGETLYWGSAQWLSPAASVQITLTALRSDMNAAMYYSSSVTYTYEPSSYVEGGLYYNVYPMLEPMDAGGYADAMARSYMSNLGVYDVALVSESTPTAEQQSYLNAKQDRMYAEQSQGIVYAGGGLSIDGIYCTAADRVYSCTIGGRDYYVEVLTETDLLWMTATTGFMSVSTCSWEAPYVYVWITAADEYDANRPLFETFCANTRVSDEFIVARGNLSTDLIAQISNTYYGNIDFDEYMARGTSADSYDSVDRFCDYILDQTAYTTSDGDPIKLPDAYEYVYEGAAGEIYACFTPDAPAGATRLYGK